MRHEFAERIDPIILAVQDLLNRISVGEKLIVSDERSRLVRLLERAQSQLGDSEEWQLTKYALCCWIDSQLMAAVWQERNWWVDNCLEARFYGRRIGYVEYFVRAKRAAMEIDKDALEVYYLGVIMGFRGFYDDGNAEYRASELRLPVSLDQWCAETARALQLKQGRPKYDDSGRVGGTARPLGGRQSLWTSAMVAVVMIAIAVGFYWIFWERLTTAFLGQGPSDP